MKDVVAMLSDEIEVLRTLKEKLDKQSSDLYLTIKETETMLTEAMFSIPIGSIVIVKKEGQAAFVGQLVCYDNCYAHVALSNEFYGIRDKKMQFHRDNSKMEKLTAAGSQFDEVKS